MTIDTREELIIALREACTIEHGLMVQYLYTALTMKRTAADGLTNAQQVLARKWQGQIIKVAHDEMIHFSMVCHILLAIGGTTKFHRPNMPQDQDYYPFKFDLIPFSDESLYRFMVFELPRGFPLPPSPVKDGRIFKGLEVRRAFVPDPLDWSYVGELYEKISLGLKQISEAELFVRPNLAGPLQWFNESAPEGGAIKSEDSADEAIKFIIEQGEGTPLKTDDSHYSVFEDMRREYEQHGRFEVSKFVPWNPATRVHRETNGEVALIENHESLKAVELFNALYSLMLFTLQFQFSLVPSVNQGADANREQRRKVLRYSSKHIMTAAIRPLAEIVCDLPFGDPASLERVGPSFELYSDISISNDEELNFSNLLERFDPMINGLNDLGESINRAKTIAETLSLIKRNLRVGKVGIGV